MAESRQAKSIDSRDENLWRVFWRGFFLPVRLIGRGLSWLAHRPPLRTIGHIVRGFFRLRAVRFTGKILGAGYFRSSWRELKQVTWPSWRESRRLTTAVIIFSVIFGGLIAIVDFGLDKLFKQLLLK